MTFRRVSDFRFLVTLDFPAEFDFREYQLHSTIVSNAEAGNGINSASFDPPVTWCNVHKYPSANNKVTISVARLALDGGQQLSIQCILDKKTALF